MTEQTEPQTIKVFEVWVPSADGSALELGAGYYGDIDSFRAASVQMGFAPGVGLPGQAWAQRRPVLFPDLADHSMFLRADAAIAAGLRMGLAIPLLDGDGVSAVVTLLCDSGVLEIWEPDAAQQVLKLRAGAYADAPAFGAVSAHCTFARGEGLPGLVWATGAPVVMQDLATANEFLRREPARAAGLQGGLGIPVLAGEALRAVVVLLSPRPIPLAAAFDFWSPAGNTVVLAPEPQVAAAALAIVSGDDVANLPPDVALLRAIWAIKAPAILRGLADPAAFLRAETATAARQVLGSHSAGQRKNVKATVVMLR